MWPAKFKQPHNCPDQQKSELFTVTTKRAVFLSAGSGNAGIRAKQNRHTVSADHKGIDERKNSNKQAPPPVK